MAFVRKHLVWILLGIALVVEGGFTFVLVGKRADAKAKLGQLEQKRQTRDRLKARKPGQPEVLKKLDKRKEAVVRERGECLLFLWHRGQALERLFPDLAAEGVSPWEPPLQMGRFRGRYQDVYDKAVDDPKDPKAGLAPHLEKLGITRKAVGLAPQNFFTGNPAITIGDIFAAQKRFWILKEIVEIAAKTDMASLGQVRIWREGEADSRTRALRRRITETKKAELYDPVLLQIVVRCEYPKFAPFLHALALSPQCLRIRSVTSIERARGSKVALRPRADLARRVRTMGRRRRIVTPEMMAEGYIPEEEPPPVERPVPRMPMMPEREPESEPMPTPETGEPTVGELVEARLECELPDFNVGIYRVTFNEAGFKSKSEAKAWVKKQLRAARRSLAGMEGLESRPTDWARNAREAIRKAQGKEPAASEDEDAGFTLTAYARSPHERQYRFADTKFAWRWLRSEARFDALRLEALGAFWQYVLDALETDRTKDEGGVVITFRPKEHFDQSKNLDQTLAPDPRDAAKKSVTVEFRLVTFEAETSDAIREIRSAGAYMR